MLSLNSYNLLNLQITIPGNACKFGFVFLQSEGKWFSKEKMVSILTAKSFSSLLFLTSNSSILAVTSLSLVTSRWHFSALAFMWLFLNHRNKLLVINSRFCITFRLGLSHWCMRCCNIAFINIVKHITNINIEK